LFRFWPVTGRLQDLPIAVIGAEESLAAVRACPDGKEAVVDGAPLGQESRGTRLLIVDLATGATRPLAAGLRRGSGSPAWAVSRDGKSVLLALQLGSFTRVISVPVRGRTAAQTLFTTASPIYYLDSAPDASVYASVTDRPAELVSRPLDQDRAQTIARFPGVAAPNQIAVLPDGRTVLTVDYSDHARLVAVGQDKNPVTVVTTTEETSAPVTVAGPQRIAFLIGPAPRQTIALADIETGGILRRIAPDKGEIGSLAASPDGAIMYFSAGSTVWAVPATGGEPRKVRAGDRVIMDPSGRALLVSVLETPGMRLFRLPLDGGPEREIHARGPRPVDYSYLSSGASNAAGRLLVAFQDSWFIAPGVLDTMSGQVLPLPFDNTSDYTSMAWLPDGRMMALHIGVRSSLWRFAPVQE
jgi:hypothetical protein